MKELIEKLNEAASKLYLVESRHLLGQAADAIECLQRDLVAADIRIANDALEIAETKRQLDMQTNSAIKFCTERNAAIEDRDAYKQAADTMAASHKVERDGLALDAARWRAYQARKDAAINAGFGKSPLRESAHSLTLDTSVDAMGGVE